ncbi:hypothetical protein BSLG_005317 [Batrachochytrium salamandrivorans]|nr:hypothetical protein BSLG_005317 [Batrachochytrium salamandrivorans]
MHDLQSRASIIGSFFLSVLAMQMSLVALTHLVLVFTQSAVVLNSFQTTKVKLVSGRVGGGDYYNYGTPHTNLGVVSFDLDADLSSYFKWNTKLLFVSAIVEFSNSQYEVNQAVIWDDVILDREDAVINLKNQRHEYQVHDLTNALGGSSANFTLQFQVVPWVGIMRSHRHVIPDAITFPVPATKKTRS